MSKIILEYSEQQQAFHFGRDEKEENTNGYVTIEKWVDRETARRFMDEVRSVNELLGNKKLSIEFVINYSSIKL